MDPVTDPAAQAEPAPEMNRILAEAKALAYEQVAAAWQVHLERIREQLDAGWRESLDEIFEQRFEEIASRLRTGFDQAVAERAQAEAERAAAFLCAEARRNTTERLNGIIRRIRQAGDDGERLRTLFDASSAFCRRPAVFRVAGGAMTLEAPRNAGAEGVAVPLASAPAFAAAVDAGDTVVAAGTPRELSQAVPGWLGDASEHKVYLFPLAVRQKTVAVLYAEPGTDGQIDVSALELLASFTAAAMESAEPVAPSGLVQLSPAPRAAAPVWTGLPRDEQELHLRAQRFARTRVAELVLRRMPAIREGRAARALYRGLKEDIDAGRDIFRRQFLDACPSMVDYYHLELVRTLAKEDATVLGPDYPGPLR